MATTRINSNNGNNGSNVNGATPPVVVVTPPVVAPALNGITFDSAGFNQDFSDKKFGTDAALTFKLKSGHKLKLAGVIDMSIADRNQAFLALVSAQVDDLKLTGVKDAIANAFGTGTESKKVAGLKLAERLAARAGIVFTPPVATPPVVVTPPVVNATP